jgi:Bacterial PH domain
MRLTAAEPTLPAAIDRYLLPHERQVTSIRQHPASLIGSAVLTFAGFLAAVIVSAVTPSGNADLILAVWAAWLILLLHLAGKVIGWTAAYFVVTSSRILLITGFLASRISVVPFMTLNDITLEEPALGRLLGYGHFHITLGAPDQVHQKIEYIRNPKETYFAICDTVFPDEKSSRSICPLCEGARNVFRKQSDRPGAAADDMAYRVPSESGQTRDDLLAEGYLEVPCPECSGSGTVYSWDD